MPKPNLRVFFRPILKFFSNNLDEIQKYFVINFLMNNNIYDSSIIRDQFNVYERATKIFRKLE